MEQVFQDISKTLQLSGVARNTYQINEDKKAVLARFNGDDIVLAEQVTSDAEKYRITIFSPKYNSNKDPQTMIRSPQKFGEQELERCQIRLYPISEFENTLTSRELQNVASRLYRREPLESLSVNPPFNLYDRYLSLTQRV